MAALHALAREPRWVAWRYESRGGKPTKIPYAPDGKRAKADDPSTWGTRTAAQTRAAKIVNGQGGGLYGGGRLRTMTTVASCDFEHWTDACATSFRRGSTSDLRLDRWNTWEEVHLGASLMIRGNVIMGIYGMWHGDPTGDRSRGRHRPRAHREQ